MGPGARTRFRRWTAFLAIAWALASLVVGIQAKLEAHSYPSLPFSFSSAAGVHVINEVSAVNPELVWMVCRAEKESTGAKQHS